MKEDPSQNSEVSHKKYSINQIDNDNQKSFEKDISKEEERQILDLLAAPMSPNQISRHYKNVFRLQRKAHKIRQVLLKNKRRIRLLNHKFDWIACHTLTLLEIDETFKGQKISLLVVVDTLTGYIFHLQWLKSRSKKGILDALMPIQDLFLNVRLVLTDGAPYFPEIVKELCPLAKHQLCLIHIMRGLFQYLRPIQAIYKTKSKKLKQFNKNLDKTISKIDKKRYKLKKYKQQEKYWIKIRQKKRNQLNITPYQKNTLSLYPELKKVNRKINNVQKSIRSLTKTIKSFKKKKAKLNQSIFVKEKMKNEVWGNYMRESNLLYRFYSLFHLKNQKYLEKRNQFIQNLPYYIDLASELAPNLLRILLKTKGLDTVNKVDAPVRLSRNFINTNVVESANSRIRPYLDHLRRIGNTEYCRTMFDFIRFILNVRRPFSGSRKNTSAIERYGYNLRGRSGLDLILDGCPSGPQFKINLPELNFNLACPSRVKGVRFPPITS